ncbi:MAG: hypothetical protein J6L00_04325, partial [Clostridia bacterium]|nr:hypothetical protein [Clostridia bacterium]
EEGRYYLGGDGAVQRWFKVGGYWYYGDPEDYGYLYNDGIYTINEKEYLFDNTGKLLQSVTVYSWERDAMVTTDSEGIIVKENPVNGWVYHVDTRWGNGNAYYYVNGSAYNGWLGNYYIQYGTMLIDDFVYDEEANVYYYVNKKGVKQGTGWYERWDDYWMYIRSDGTVVYDDWLKIGTKWYYFDEYQMASGDSYKIDGVWHSFDDNGVWLGETKDITPDCTGKADGWFKYNGEWYFAMAGKVATDRDLYSNGKWYHLDYQGCMIADTFWYNPYAKDESFRYFTADGSMATYKGWQRSKGYWVYFDNANSVRLGWLNVGGKTYYQSIFADENGSYITFNIGILTGYQVIDDVLYQFNSDGALVKTITTKGWYKGGSDWYYIEADGFVARNESAYKIGNAYYAFDGDGKMVANDVYDGHYYNASGAMVTKAGWYQIGKKWIYVMDGGIVAQNGVLRIGNKDYYFSDSYWLG